MLNGCGYIFQLDESTFVLKSVWNICLKVGNYLRKQVSSWSEAPSCFGFRYESSLPRSFLEARHLWIKYNFDIPGKAVYPDNLDCVRCTRSDIREFAEKAKAIGIQYIGLCCGNSAILTREVAEVYGKNPPASKYATTTQKSFIFGDAAGEYGEEMRKLARFMKGE